MQLLKHFFRGNWAIIWQMSMFVNFNVLSFLPLWVQTSAGLCLSCPVETAKKQLENYFYYFFVQYARSGLLPELGKKQKQKIRELMKSMEITPDQATSECLKRFLSFSCIKCRIQWTSKQSFLTETFSVVSGASWVFSFEGHESFEGHKSKEDYWLYDACIYDGLKACIIQTIVNAWTSLWSLVPMVTVLLHTCWCREKVVIR